LIASGGVLLLHWFGFLGAKLVSTVENRRTSCAVAVMELAGCKINANFSRAVSLSILTVFSQNFLLRTGLQSLFFSSLRNFISICIAKVIEFQKW
jgi:hypothetical protein